MGHVRSAKIQIRLRICAVWSESSLCAFWKDLTLSFIMRANKSLIRPPGCAGWFESSQGAHVRKYVFSRCGSNIKNHISSDVNIVFLIFSPAILPFCYLSCHFLQNYCYQQSILSCFESLVLLGGTEWLNKIIDEKPRFILFNLYTQTARLAPVVSAFFYHSWCNHLFNPISLVYNRN